MSSIDASDIRAARERAGLTQAAAAALIARNWRTWSSYESGERGIDPILWKVWLIRAGIAPVDSIK
jgi:DNA-binding transcriptional regulator YiaG